MSLFLSKSGYIHGKQCLKQLWLDNNTPELKDDTDSDDSIFAEGSEVGALAREFFAPYELVEFTDLHTMTCITSRFLHDGVNTIAEASFSYNGLFCSIDILRHYGNKRIEIYEVKSSTSASDVYVWDISFQRYILENLGFTVIGTYLIHINKHYVRNGKLDLKEFFIAENITALTKERQEMVQKDLSYLEDHIELPHEPEIDIGAQCFSPYACPYWCHCTKHLPHPNIFDVSSVQLSTKLKNYQRGIVSYKDIYENNAVSKNSMLQVEFELNNSTDYIDKKQIRKVLDNLYYPLYFLDFESFNPAIPTYEKTSPYEQIPFQYSLHYYESENAELMHKEFLAYPGSDPRRQLAENLVKDIPLDTCTIAYNMSFEKSVIKKLAALYTDLSDHLLNISDHMQDLIIPFRKKYYYSKDMQGSYSIKYVLPALFPDDKELDYHSLEGVHNGKEASDMFKMMQHISGEELEKSRSSLLSYCSLDTYAMVKIYQKLKEVTS